MCMFVILTNWLKPPLVYGIALPSFFRAWEKHGTNPCGEQSVGEVLCGEALQLDRLKRLMLKDPIAS